MRWSMFFQRCLHLVERQLVIAASLTVTRERILIKMSSGSVLIQSQFCRGNDMSGIKLESTLASWQLGIYFTIQNQYYHGPHTSSFLANPIGFNLQASLTKHKKEPLSLGKLLFFNLHNDFISVLLINTASGGNKSSKYKVQTLVFY